MREQKSNEENEEEASRGENMKHTNGTSRLLDSKFFTTLWGDALGNQPSTVWADYEKAESGLFLFVYLQK